MKKTVLAAATIAVLGVASSAATADVLRFDDQTGGSFNFDYIDLAGETGSQSAAVTQTDDGDGAITGTDTFLELGGTYALEMKEDGNTTWNILDSLAGGYDLFFNYSLEGSVDGTITDGVFGDFIGGTDNLLLDIEVNFIEALSSADFWIDSLFNQTFDAGSSTKLIDFTVLGNSSCSLSAIAYGSDKRVEIEPGSSGNSCAISMEFDVLEAGYFFDEDGHDLADFEGPLSTLLEVTVQQLNGLNFFYDVAGGTQEFTISHDGNLSGFVVPEPGSLALIAAGLLGVAGAARRRKQV